MEVTLEHLFYDGFEVGHWDGRVDCLKLLFYFRLVSCLSNCEPDKSIWLGSYCFPSMRTIIYIQTPVRRSPSIDDIWRILKITDFADSLVIRRSIFWPQEQLTNYIPNTAFEKTLIVLESIVQKYHMFIWAPLCVFINKYIETLPPCKFEVFRDYWSQILGFSPRRLYHATSHQSLQEIIFIVVKFASISHPFKIFDGP